MIASFSLSLFSHGRKWRIANTTLPRETRLGAGDHLGFEILYVDRSAVRKYWPDFHVRLNCGVMLIIEIKGVETDETRAKHKFLDEWVRAINQSNGFGQWKWALVTNPANVDAVLTEAAAHRKDWFVV